MNDLRLAYIADGANGCSLRAGRSAHLTGRSGKRFRSRAASVGGFYGAVLKWLTREMVPLRLSLVALGMARRKHHGLGAPH
ncbi:hypothetical protein D3C80_1440890 [compost metagenome]